MSENMNLKAQDGHELSAYVARPAGEPIGALVLIQEIFGVNAHIRGVADGYARDGFLVVAPALFDRTERGVELKYEGEDAKKAYSLMGTLNPDTALLDIAAAYELAKEAGKGVGVIGFCFGGLMSWLTATRGEALKMQPSCCVGYYPGGIGKFAAEEPSCPVLLHFGGDDTHIGADQIEAVRSAHPEVEIYIYPGAEHGFNCDARASYNPPSAKLARERTLAFLKTHVA
ncbi:MAG: Carboxymethylenebutenolidase [Edaphobacter sp.]|jgi:carboxymethylenebutenolidase|nr:Carboxymethylenebutenolidase [Edaphobacter sp.]